MSEFATSELHAVSVANLLHGFGLQPGMAQVRKLALLVRREGGADDVDWGDFAAVIDCLDGDDSSASPASARGDASAAPPPLTPASGSIFSPGKIGRLRAAFLSCCGVGEEDGEPALHRSRLVEYFRFVGLDPAEDEQEALLAYASTYAQPFFVLDLTA